MADREAFENARLNVASIPPQRPDYVDAVAGTAFGDYVIEGEIARGGMGVVYRARQPRLERVVALKVILSGRFASASEIRRFRAEAEHAARLDHPHIVPIYDSGEDGGRAYFAMKLIDGPSLAQPGAFPAAAALRASGPASREAQKAVGRFMALAAHAVHHAHQRGLLHRDLKPANILVDPGGGPQLTDFGIARPINAPVAGSGATAFYGTPEFMAPEAGQPGNAPTVAEDIYSLGAILYEMLTLPTPEERGLALDCYKRSTASEPSSPALQNPELSQDLATICQMALRRNPADRYGSALAMARDLENFVEGLPVLARRLSFSGRVWRAAVRRPALAIVASVACVLALIVAVGSPIALAIVHRAKSEAVARLVQSKVSQARLARNAQYLGRRESGERAVFEAAAFGSTPALVNEGLAQVAQADFVGVGPKHPLAPRGAGFALDPGFKVVATGRKGGVDFLDVATATVVWAWRSADAAVEFEQVVSSSDGRHWVAIDENETATLLDFERHEAVKSYRNYSDAQFSADGRRLLLGHYRRFFQIVDIADGSPVKTAPWPSFLPAEVVLSPDSSRPLIASFSGREVVLWNWLTGAVVQELRVPEIPYRIAWSDGKLVVGDLAGGIMVWDTVSGRPLRLLGHLSAISGLWIVAGGSLLFSTAEDGQCAAWSLSEGGRLLADDTRRLLAVSADGRRLALSDGQSWQLAEAAPIPGIERFEPRDTGDPAVRSMAFSPDSRWLSVTRQSGVHLIDLARGRMSGPTEIDGALAAFWLPTGNEIVLQGRSDLVWLSLLDGGSGAALREIGRWSTPPSVWMARGSLSTNGTLCVPLLNREVRVFPPGARTPVRQMEQPRLAAAAISPSAELTAILYLPLSESDRRNSRVELRGRAGLLPGWPQPCNDGALVFSPDESSVCVSSKDHYVIFDLGGRVLKRVECIASGQTAPFAWSPVRRTAAEWVSRGILRITDIEGQTPDLDLAPPSLAEWSALTFSGDGLILASGSNKGGVTLWRFPELASALKGLGLRPRWPSSPVQDGSGPRRPGSPRLQTDDVIWEKEPPDAIPPRPAAFSQEQIDLTRFYTHRLDQDWQGTLSTPANLGRFPTGAAVFMGVVFDARGVLMMQSRETDRNLPSHPPFPAPHRSVRIPVGFACRRVHWLGNLNYGYHSVPDSEEVAVAVVRYASGETATAPLRKGVEFIDWWEKPGDPTPHDGPGTVWHGFTPGAEAANSEICVNLFTWENPHPETPVVDITVTSSGKVPALFLLAITAER